MRGLVSSCSAMGASLRGLLHSPVSVKRKKRSGNDLFPLLMPEEWRGALRHFAEEASWTEAYSGGSSGGKSRNVAAWTVVAEVWSGLMVIGLNTSLDLCTDVGLARSPLEKGVLERLSRDARVFVEGDGLSNKVVRRPEVPWGRRICDLSVSYGGEVVEKARMMSWRQIEPGLPPPGKGGLLDARDFCDEWVAAHLDDAELSRKSDSEIPGPLPYATVRASEDEWNIIAAEMIRRGVARIMAPEDIATYKQQKILNGAFGVVKPNKWVGEPADNVPVLRLIMDFRAANAVHRMLPGGVSSLVGAAKWQGFCLSKGEVLVSSGDDLVSCFYLFKLPYSWSRYFTFRTPVKRSVLGLPNGGDELVYIASQVLPMGWAAAVTVMQHIHRNMALRSEGLPLGREIHRERPLPEKETKLASAFWNLYVDDLTIMEIVGDEVVEKVKRGEEPMSGLQESMQNIYKKLGVPYSSDKTTSREERCEKLGALVDGQRGILGVTSARALDFISLALYVMGQERVPTKWMQIVLGKFVHLVQFRRPLFTFVKHGWSRIQSLSHGGPLEPQEVDELLRLCLMLPLCFTNLRAKIASRVTCSDASEFGGGFCISTGLTSLNSIPSRINELELECSQEFFTIEWFAGIGGMSRSLERLGLRTHQTVVCENDENCVSILRRFLPGTIVWKDIKEVDAEMVRSAFDTFPNAKGVLQSGGSPCQGLSQLSSERLHFDDGRSALFFELVRVMDLVKDEAKKRAMWHRGFVENVICDPEDQKIFRETTCWAQWLMCSRDMSTVRRPRFFWISDEVDESIFASVELGPHYKVAHLVGPSEDPNLWPLPGWRWLGEGQLPTFTRSIPRWKPPASPAGISHTDKDSCERWKSDWYRFPPYTYKPENCLTDGVNMRVACAEEREILMGFSPGHTAGKRGKGFSEDVRCSMVGNSFHTGVIAMLLKACLTPFFPGVGSLTPKKLMDDLNQEVQRSQRERYVGHSSKPKWAPDETYLDRLEQQNDALAVSVVSVDAQQQVVRDLLRHSSYRGTDVHVDTLQFFRPDRLPRTSIDARRWQWKISKGWRWKYSNHINVLELEALLKTVQWRAKSLNLFDKRFLHLVDSQVALGVAAKGRTSSKRLSPTLHRYNLWVLACHCYPVIGWVATHHNPADEPSRWYDPPSLVV